MYLTFFSGESLIGKDFIWSLVRNEVGINHLERIMKHWFVYIDKNIIKYYKLE